jgi:transcriptional regulator with XRE-family HTH domain
MKFYDFDELEKDVPEETRKKAREKADQIVFQLTLSKIREEMEITQEELAKALNVKQSAISKMEKREGISLGNLQKMIKAMGGEIDIKIKFPTRRKLFKLDLSFSH